MNAEDGSDEKEIRKVGDNHLMIAPVWSPDGNFLALSYFDSQNKKWKIAVEKFADNSVVKEFEASAFDFVGWTPDSKNLLYILPEIPREGGSLWLQPIDGSPSKLLLDGKTDKVLWAE